MSVRKFTNRDAAFYHYKDQEIFVGDVVDASNSDTMSVGFYRNMKKGGRNEWIVNYDEALIVTRGSLTVRSENDATTAQVGEVLFLTKGTEIAYEAAEDNTEAVYVTFPHWVAASEQFDDARPTRVISAGLTVSMAMHRCVLPRRCRR